MAAIEHEYQLSTEEKTEKLLKRIEKALDTILISGLITTTDIFEHEINLIREHLKRKINGIQLSDSDIKEIWTLYVRGTTKETLEDLEADEPSRPRPLHLKSFLYESWGAEYFKDIDQDTINDMLNDI